MSGADAAGSASIPAGLAVTMHRARIRPGQEAEADRWLAMLDERHDEAEATLDREAMVLELVFRDDSGADGPELVWVTVCGPGLPVESSPHPIDRDHLDFDRRVREPGWRRSSARLLLAPAPLRAAAAAWLAAPGVGRPM